jgi:mono/diheme cytochrome c family protein
LALLALAAAIACKGSETAGLSAEAQRGRGVYMNVCVACHNADPGKDGAIGPNLVGTTRELIEWRVVKGAYPPGYTPKRATGAMPAFPHLAGDVDALYAFVRESTARAPQ